MCTVYVHRANPHMSLWSYNRVWGPSTPRLLRFAQQSLRSG